MKKTIILILLILALNVLFVSSQPVNCTTCLNTTINCSISYSTNSTGYMLQQEYCGKGEKMYIALAIFIAMTMAGFVFLGNYLNNARIELENVSADQGAKGLFRLRTGMLLKSLYVGLMCILILTLIGFAYNIAQGLGVIYTQLVFVYWIMCAVILLVVFIAFIYKAFTFPFGVVGELLEKQKSNNRR